MTTTGTITRAFVGLVVAVGLTVQGSAQPATATVIGKVDPFPLVKAITLSADCIPDCETSPNKLSSGPGRMFVDVARRQLIALPGAGTAAYLVDVDKMQQTAVIPIPPGGTGTSAYDATGRRLFIGERSQGGDLLCVQDAFKPGGDVPGCVATRPRTIRTLSLSGGPASTFTFPGLAASTTDPAGSTGFAGHGVEALAYDPRTDVLFAVTFLKRVVPVDTSKPLKTQVTLHALSASNLKPGARPLWSLPLPDCGQPLGWNPYLGVGTNGRFLYMACQGFQAEPFIPTPNGVIVVNLNSADPSRWDVSKFSTEFHHFAALLTNGFSIGDPAGDRVMIVPAAGSTNRLYAFDAMHRAWTGAVPMGSKNMRGGVADTRTGRVYTLDDGRGIVASDAGAVPMFQGNAYDVGTEFSPNDSPAFDPLTRRLFITGTNLANEPRNSTIRVYEDRTPPLIPAPRPHPDELTNDIDEARAAQVSFTGGASAFGARLFIPGGVGGTAAAGVSQAAPDERLRLNRGDRGLYLGRVSRAQLTGDGSSGTASATATGLEVDDATATDLRARIDPASAGTPAADDLAYDALIARVGESHPSECGDLGGADDRRSDQNDGSAVKCVHGQEASADARSSETMSDLATFKVAYAESRVASTRDSTRGVVTTATAISRGVAVSVPAGRIDIGEVTSRATTWAHGRPGTAGSELAVTVKNATVSDASGPRFACDACDIQALVRAINTYLTQQVQAFGPRRDLDPTVSGSARGAQALVVKDDYAKWSDINVNGDSQREVSGLQIIVYNDARQPSRAILQLAAVLAESQYLVGQLRPPVVVDPTKLVVQLVDDVGDELPGGVFEVRPAGAEQGALAAVDSELAGTCVTDDDGIGDCTFDDLPPGDYDITQVTAPTGYATAEGTTVTLSPGYRTDVVFTNLRAIGSIALTLTDDGEDPKPLAGAAFSVYADDGDLVLGDGDQLYDQCTTDDDGGCTFDEVPLGAYVVTQTAAPAEHLKADDVGFVLEAPGQVANLSFVTGLTPIPPTPGTPGTPGTEAEEIVEDEPVVTASVDAPTETTTVVVTSPPTRPIAQVTQTPLPTGGGGVRRLLALPADTLRYLARRPLQALLFGLLWALLGAPLYLALRRRSLTLVKAVA